MRKVIAGTEADLMDAVEKSMTKPSFTVSREPHAVFAKSTMSDLNYAFYFYPRGDNQTEVEVLIASAWLKPDQIYKFQEQMLSALFVSVAQKPSIAPAPTSTQTTGPSPTVVAGKSDIDELPVGKAKSNTNAYAIVIGIENYRQKLPKADFATADAKLVTEYLTKALGYPEENVITLLNEHATKSDFEKYIEEWLPKNFDKNGSLFIYYSGHGAPNPKTGDAFIVPYDGDPNFIEKTGYPLKKLYDNLAKLPAKEVIVALDSCFSGAGGKSVLAEGSRPLVMNLQTTITPIKNMIIMAASSGSEISSTYKDKGHGLFTYFLLKGIKGEADVNEDGKIEIEELYRYLKPQVQKTARKLYNNEQTPQLIAPEAAIKGILLQK